MATRIDDGGAANGLPAILIDGSEAGRLVPTPTGFKARMTRWRAYNDEEFGNIHERAGVLRARVRRR